MLKYNNNEYMNRKYNRLTPISVDEKSNHHWICKCDCGNIKSIDRSRVITGKTKSCGCIQKEQLSKRLKKEGTENKRLHRIWKNMRQRCSNPKLATYKNYMARGITICEEWNDYTEFYKWALANGYRDDLTIDRIDNDGNYCPENCRWVDRGIQNRNRRGLNVITFNGKTKCLAEWAREIGMNLDALDTRLKRGWTVEQAFTIPPGGRRNG